MVPIHLLASLPIAASASLAIRAASLGDRRAVYVFKPLTTVLILAATLLLFTPALHGYQLLILLGLALSLAGDVLLMLPKDRFTAGLVAFLLAHLTYIAAFTLGIGIGAAQGPWLLPFALACGAVFRYLRPALGPFTTPVAVYVVVITVMAWRAAVRALAPGVAPFSGWTACAGACLFLVSDSALAIARFRRPFRGSESLVLSTYWVAQYLIGLSAVGS